MRHVDPECLVLIVLHFKTVKQNHLTVLFQTLCVTAIFNNFVDFKDFAWLLDFNIFVTSLFLKILYDICISKTSNKCYVTKFLIKIMFQNLFVTAPFLLFYDGSVSKILYDCQKLFWQGKMTFMKWYLHYKEILHRGA